MSFKNPSFQDRIGSAAEAKAKALEQLRAKPPLDPQVVAERKAAAAAKAEREAHKAAEKKAAREAEAAARTSVPAPPTEAERKASRDARYAARKARK